MDRGKVKIDVRFLNADASAIDITGELTAFAEEPFMEAYFQAVQGAVRVVILNFSALDYMTSSGIGLLVTLFIRANRQGRQLYAVGLNSHYQRIFSLTKLNETIPVFATEEEVLQKITAV